MTAASVARPPFAPASSRALRAALLAGASVIALEAAPAFAVTRDISTITDSDGLPTGYLDDTLIDDTERTEGPWIATLGSGKTYDFPIEGQGIGWNIRPWIFLNYGTLTVNGATAVGAGGYYGGGSTGTTVSTIINTGGIFAIGVDAVAGVSAGRPTVILNSGIVEGFTSGVEVTNSTGLDPADPKVSSQLTNTGIIRSTDPFGGVGVILSTTGGSTPLVTLTNSGTIEGTQGVEATIASVSNSGLISGGVLLRASALTNTGTILGFGGTAIGGTDRLATGPTSLTVTNAGTVQGTRAIYFDVSRPDTSIAVVLDTGNALVGRVDIANGALAQSAALRFDGTGTANLSDFTGFQTLDVSPDASWVVTGGTEVYDRITNQGTLAVGGTNVATVSLTSSFTQSNAGVLQVAAAPDGGLSNIVLTGAAVIDGAVRVFATDADGSKYKTRPPVSIFYASGGLTGTFTGGASSNYAFLVPILSYTPTDVLLSYVIPTPNTDYSTPAVTPGQKAVGSGINIAAKLPDDPLRPLIDWLEGKTLEGAQRGLGSIAGGVEIPSVRGRALDTLGWSLSQSFLQPALMAGSGTTRILAEAPSVKRVRYAQAGGPIATDASEPAPQGSIGMWSNAFGSFGTIGPAAGGLGNAGFKAGGIAFGADTPITPEIVVGIAGGYAMGDFDYDGLDARTDVRSGAAALYASWRRDKAYAAATLGYAYNDIASKRTVDVGAGPARSEGRTHANQILSEGEVGYEAWRVADVGLIPFVGFQASALWQAGYTEEGGGLGNLAVDGQQGTSVRTVAGLKAVRDVTFDEGREVQVSLKAGWAHAVLEQAGTTSARFAAAPAAGFTLADAKGQKDAVLLGLGVGALLGDAVTGYARYDGELGAKDQVTKFTVGLRVTW
jgi:outer membrane autotransporter protein